MPQWNWIALGVLAILVLYLQFRINLIRENSRRREELFQIVTENAADMIALVDMKGRRLYNSPAYKRALGYSAAELGETSSFEQIHPDDRFKVLEAAREARSSGIGRKLDYRIRHKDGTWQIATLVKESAIGAQQSATACQDLSGLALDLQTMVGKFKLEDGAPGSPENSSRVDDGSTQLLSAHSKSFAAAAR